VDDPNHIRVTRKQVRRRSVARSKPESLLLDIYSELHASNSNLEDRVISPLPWGELYSDNTGTPRVAAAENEDSTFDVSYKDETDWVEIGGLLQVNNQPLKYFDFVGFNSTNDKFYFIGAGESGIRGLYQYDHQNEKHELIFQHPDFDIGYEDLVFSSDGTTILGAKVAGDVYQKFYFQEHPESDLHQSLDASFPGELVEVISTTRDATIAIIRVSSPKRLGDIYLLDTTVPRLDLLLTGSDLLLPEFMADVSPFTIEATDGLEIHGYVTKPQGMSSAVPMIVMPHGGPIGIRDVPLFNREVQFFAHHGFAVVQVNFRGSGGYGVPFEEAGYREWGLGIIDDITRATNWAIENGIAQQGKICIYGASFGGYAALTSVIKEPDLYRCAIGYAGLYDLTKLDRSDIPWQPGGDNYIEEAVGVNESELRAQSPVYNADKIEVPILLAHGGKDRRAPPFHARDMRKALRDNDKDVEWLYERGEAHGFYNTEININFYNQILAFLNKHLN
jgi:dipeptidyl aminopeptidase/acylaminoacyl peptidase